MQHCICKRARSVTELPRPSCRSHHRLSNLDPAVLHQTTDDQVDNVVGSLPQRSQALKLDTKLQGKGFDVFRDRSFDSLFQLLHCFGAIHPRPELDKVHAAYKLRRFGRQDSQPDRQEVHCEPLEPRIGRHLSE